MLGKEGLRPENITIWRSQLADVVDDWTLEPQDDDVSLLGVDLHGAAPKGKGDQQKTSNVEGTHQIAQKTAGSKQTHRVIHRRERATGERLRPGEAERSPRFAPSPSWWPETRRAALPPQTLGKPCAHYGPASSTELRALKHARARRQAIQSRG